MSELLKQIAEKTEQANALALQAGELEKQARQARMAREQIKMELAQLHKQAQAEKLVEAEQQAASSAAQALKVAEEARGETVATLDELKGLIGELRAEREALEKSKAEAGEAEG